jgi:hypothetical protein
VFGVAPPSPPSGGAQLSGAYVHVLAAGQQAGHGSSSAGGAEGHGGRGGALSAKIHTARSQRAMRVPHTPN